MEKKIKKKELIEILEENYYTLTTTGAEAVATIFDEYSRGSFEPNLEEWGISSDRLLQVINSMVDDWCKTGKMDTPAVEFHKTTPGAPARRIARRS
jgi:hypothetical protein